MINILTFHLFGRLMKPLEELNHTYFYVWLHVVVNKALFIIIFAWLNKRTWCTCCCLCKSLFGQIDPSYKISWETVVIRGLTPTSNPSEKSDNSISDYFIFLSVWNRFINDPCLDIIKRPVRLQSCSFIILESTSVKVLTEWWKKLIGVCVIILWMLSKVKEIIYQIFLALYYSHRWHNINSNRLYLRVYIKA